MPASAQGHRGNGPVAVGEANSLGLGAQRHAARASLAEVAAWSAPLGLAPDPLATRGVATNPLPRGWWPLGDKCGTQLTRVESAIVTSRR